MGVSYRYSRRKIRLDRGDTLGGTVPLSLRNHVQPDVGFGERRFARRRRRGGSGLLSWFLTILLALAIAGAIGLFLGTVGTPTDGAAGEAAAEGAGLMDTLGGWFDALIERARGLFDS